MASCGRYCMIKPNPLGFREYLKPHFGVIASGISGNLSDGGGTRGIFQVLAVFEYVTIATPGNCTDFGDPSVTRSLCGTCNNDTRGILAGGGGAYYDTIDYITVATPGNATDFGDLTQTMGYLVGYNSDVRGVIAGGYKGGNQLNPNYKRSINTPNAGPSTTSQR